MSVDPISNRDDDSTGNTSGSNNPSRGSNSSGNGKATVSGGSGLPAMIESRLPALPSVGWSYGPPAKPEILKAKPNPIELLHAVRRRWPLALGLATLVSTLIVGTLWYFIPVKYEAFALLKVSGKPPSVLQDSAAAVDEFAVFKRTQVQLLLSNVVLQGTLRDTAINRLTTIKQQSDDTISWLKDQLIVDYPNDAEIMRIAMKGERKDDLMKIINKVVAVYMEEIVAREKELRLFQENKLSQTYAAMQTDLQKQLDSLHTLEALHKTSGSEAAKMAKDMAVQELNNYMARKTRIFTELKDNEKQLTLAKARRDNPDETRPPDIVIEMEISKDRIIEANTLELSQVTRALSSMKQRNPNSVNLPSYKRLQEQAMQLENDIEERRNSLRPRFVEMLAASGSMNSSAPANHLVNLSVPLLEKQREFLTQELDAANTAIDNQLKHVNSLESFSAQVASKQEDIRALQRINSDLRGKLDQIKLEKLAQDRITKVDDAILANGTGDAIRKYVGVAFAGLLSFGLVVLGVAFLEFQKRKVNSVEEVNDGLGIKVIGELPSVSGRTWRRMKGGKGPAVLKALMAERIDGTRTAVIHTSAIDPPRVIMVTSAEPHEGKTTAATQLAASLARSGRRTLLIDADVRNPGAHRVFELPQDPGLCELLRGEAERDAVVHPTRTANLWLMPAGRCCLQSVQALSTSYLGTAIASMCVQYDYVVIDAGPVLKIADPLLIGQHVDAAILSVLRDVSKVPKVYEACERLRSVGVTVLGAVVNGVNDDAARHGVELLMAEQTQAAPAEPTTA